MIENQGPNETRWIAVDWGTSSFRAWLMHAGAALENMETGDGLLSLRQRQEPFEAAALRLLAAWLPAEKSAAPINVLMCGMVGSRQGWMEAPYVPTPASLAHLSQHIVRAPSTSNAAHFYIVPGVSQAVPADVMRGEETQLLGAASSTQWPNKNCLAIMPGTHCKQVIFNSPARTIERFSTYLTGELFALLKQHSLLAAAMQGSVFDETVFCQAVRVGAQEQPNHGRLLNELFATRARGLLGTLPPEHTEAWLSGLLIGHELGGQGAATPVVLIGDSALCKRYHLALQTLGFPEIQTAPSTSSAQGLWQLYQQWQA